MRRYARTAMATLLTAAATTLCLASAGAASAAPVAARPLAVQGSASFTGFGISSIPQFAIMNAENQARSLAANAGFQPYAQCGLGARFLSNPMPNFYSAQVQLLCYAP